MALPVLRGVGGKVANATSAAVTAPTGLADGDLDIMFAEVPTGATLAITTAGGGSWTAMTGTPLDVTSGEKLYIWWRIHNAAGDSNPTLTQTSGDHFCAARVAYQASTFDTSDPFEAEETGTETTSDTSFSFATANSTSGADRLVLCCATIKRDSNTGGVPVMANSNLTSLNSRENICTNLGGGGGLGVTEGALASAGAIGTWSCTYSTASTKAYLSFAIKPAATTLTPAQLVHTRDIFSPTVSPEVLPEMLVHSRAIFGPTVSLGTTLTPDRIDHTRDIFSPAVSPSLAPARLDHDRAIFSLQTNVIIPLARLDHTRDIFSPTIPGAGGGPDLGKTAMRRRRRRKVV